MLLPVEHAENRGFTLIEVMIAIFIMMIGLLALLQSVNLAISFNSSNKLRNDFGQFADQAVGTVRTQAFGAVASSANYFSGTSGSTPGHKSGLGFVNYSVVNTVSDLTTHSFATDKIAGSKNLEVKIAWRDRGVKKTHTITTTIIEAAN